MQEIYFTFDGIWASQSATWSRALTVPFWKTFVNQTSTSWEIPYTFSGKEKDGEIKPLGADSLNTFKNKQDMRQTGYSYFGARYYDSEISIWLSVDQMSVEYPSMSPYMYVAGNPVMYIDSDGRKLLIHYERPKIGLYGKKKRDSRGDIIMKPASFKYKGGEELPDNKLVEETVAALDYLVEKGVGNIKGTDISVN